MNNRILIGIGMAAALCLGGCVAGNQSWPTGTLAPVEDPTGEARVRIESRPSGALVSVQGRVVGHTPIEVTLPVTRHGFFPDRTTVSVRFLAEDQSFGPVGVSARFGPMDKVPRGVVFTPHTFWPVRH